MRVAILAVLGLIVADVSVTRAEPPGLVIPVPEGSDIQGAPTIMVVMPEAAPPTETSSYRWQLVAADAAAVGSLALALRDGNRGNDWGTLGLATYALGPPIVHAANGHGGRALGSLTLRVGLPLIGGLVGASLDAPPSCAPNVQGNDSFCDGSFPGNGLAKGLALGAVAAMALDTWLLARPERRPARGWSPNASALRGGASFGVSGAF